MMVSWALVCCRGPEWSREVGKWGRGESTRRFLKPRLHFSHLIFIHGPTGRNGNVTPRGVSLFAMCVPLHLETFFSISVSRTLCPDFSSRRTSSISYKDATAEDGKDATRTPIAYEPG